MLRATLHLDGLLLSSDNVTLIVQRFCHPLSWKAL